VGGHEDDREAGIALLDGSEHPQSVQPGHVQVADDQVEAPALKLVQGFPAGFGQFHRVSQPGQGREQGLPEMPFVVGH
jgi:hypothetical protein